MSAMNLDRPLDDIISEKRKQRRPAAVARRGGKANHTTGPIRHGRTTTRPQPVAMAAPAAKILQLPAQMGQGSKIIVSNLPTDVTENQIRELFSTTVGPVMKVALSYDNRGQSKGTAQVEFKRNDDATKAFQQYNKRLIDQNRPMKVEIILDPARIPPPPLSTRVAPAPKPAVSVRQAAPAAGQPRRTGGKPRGKNNKQPPKSAADLDAEMEDYQKAKE
ncbi:uncharacterized protein MELLADRAFT_71269 [Melampsora larici-populina 98AG31]|uniref:RRM domain-containing protein n=1 Tax=Melampsora larici-populina (strain 98AG31 / pathotype 3-4-7) TaxID=747676 RepID=F4REB6_MELLP|nr:uncharacterized protein MELLADRAFT_71269 [Melampsora larici-populina 98AG31]EGG09296.1 hypothetical protein MELLADRAFT_71269 [Melampsora larici-populina 98AG31]